MYSFKKYILAIALNCLVLCGFSQSSNTFDWLIGKWKVQRPNETNLEIWQKQSDSLFVSKSFTVKQNDTTLFETVQLIKKNQDWYYIVTANDQNDNNPVAFKLEFVGSKEFICLNLQHDFPTRIAYRLANNMLYASIEGIVNGKHRKVNFDYKKY